MIEWRFGSRLGKILFSTGVAGGVLLGKEFGGRHRILVGIIFSAVGVGLLLLGVFERDAGFRGAKLFPQSVPFARVAFVFGGCAALIAPELCAPAASGMRAEA